MIPLSTKPGEDHGAGERGRGAGPSTEPGSGAGERLLGPYEQQAESERKARRSKRKPAQEG